MQHSIILDQVKQKKKILIHVNNIGISNNKKGADWEAHKLHSYLME